MNTNTIGIGGYFCAKKKKKKEICGEFLSVVGRLEEEEEVSETLYIYCPPGSLSLVLSFFCRVFFVFISCKIFKTTHSSVMR